MEMDGGGRFHEVFCLYEEKNGIFDLTSFSFSISTWAKSLEVIFPNKIFNKRLY